jgi:hypothetical protein
MASQHFGIAGKITFISTEGGASPSSWRAKKLPGVATLGSVIGIKKTKHNVRRKLKIEYECQWKRQRDDGA